MIITDISEDGAKHATFAQRFTSWADLLDSSKAGAEDLREKHSRYMPLKEVDAGDDTFHFPTFEAASVAAADGWRDGTKQLLDSVDKIADRIGDIADTMLKQISYDVAGELPDVGAYCAGVAEHMMSWPIDSGAAPVIKIGIGIAKAHHVTAAQSANHGAAVIALIDALELAGRDVELIAHNCTYDSGAQRVQYLTIKAAGEHIDRDRLAYALVSADMLRRTVLGALGAENKHTYGGGYGYPLHLGDVNRLDELAPELTGMLDVPGFAGLSNQSQADIKFGSPDRALDVVLSWAEEAGLIA